MAAIGSTRTAAGIGGRIIRGAGRRSIMGAGICIQVVVGYGCRAQFGRRRGYAGVHTEPIVDGRRCPRTRYSRPASAGVIMAFT